MKILPRNSFVYRLLILAIFIVLYGHAFYTRFEFKRARAEREEIRKLQEMHTNVMLKLTKVFTIERGD